MVSGSRSCTSELGSGPLLQHIVVFLEFNRRVRTKTERTVELSLTNVRVRLQA